MFADPRVFLEWNGADQSMLISPVLFYVQDKKLKKQHDFFVGLRDFLINKLYACGTKNRNKHIICICALRS